MSRGAGILILGVVGLAAYALAQKGSASSAPGASGTFGIIPGPPAVKGIQGIGVRGGVRGVGAISLPGTSTTYASIGISFSGSISNSGNSPWVVRYVLGVANSLNSFNQVVLGGALGSPQTRAIQISAAVTLQPGSTTPISLATPNTFIGQAWYPQSYFGGLQVQYQAADGTWQNITSLLLMSPATLCTVLATDPNTSLTLTGGSWGSVLV